MITRSATAVAIILAISSQVSAGTASIGSVISQGDLRIDNHSVSISGTVFDGSLIETGHGAISSANVRLDGNYKVTLYGDSRGAFYRDRLTLFYGEVKVAASERFRTEVTGLIIVATEPDTTGYISVGRDGVVNISAEAGSFRVAKDGGQFVAQVNAREPMAFHPQANGSWRQGAGSEENFGGDYPRCYVDDDDRDCDRRHHRHRSK